jgi:hypothetical protein
VKEYGEPAYDKAAWMLLYRIAFARKTLRISPLCTDAYVLLADRLADLNRNIIVDGRLPNKRGLSE